MIVKHKVWQRRTRRRRDHKNEAEGVVALHRGCVQTVIDFCRHYVWNSAV